jgi:hypothetical protein
MYNFDALWAVLEKASLPGAVVALAVLAFVYLGRFTDVFKTGTIRRWAAVLSALLFAGVEPGEVSSAVIAAVGLVLATLSNLFLEFLAKSVKAGIVKAAQKVVK